jgi:hypothetical protein
MLPSPGEPGTVFVAGSDGADTVFIRMIPAGNSSYGTLDINGHLVSAADVTDIVFNGLGGDDLLVIDHGPEGGQGSFVGLPRALDSGLPILFEGGTGFDEVHVFGDPGASVDMTYEAGPLELSLLEVRLTSLTPTHGQQVRMHDVENVLTLTPAATLKVLPNGNDSPVELVNGPMVYNHVTNQVYGGSPALPPITFARAADLYLVGTDYDDVFVLNNPAPAEGLESVTVDGLGGKDTVINPGGAVGIEWVYDGVEFVSPDLSEVARLLEAEQR